MPASTDHSLGADLVWWRVRDGARTVVTLLQDPVRPFDDLLHVDAHLHDGDGTLRARWRVDLPPDTPVFLDSQADGPWRDAGDGLLVLHACTDGPPSAEARERYVRLFPLVDWQQADGRIATLHSDQTMDRHATGELRFTEIVVLETADETNALVFLNGEHPQAAEALEITVRNAGGAERTARYPTAMRPFTVHRVALAGLFEDIAGFAGGQPLQASGRFRASGLFLRPYVETTGRRWGVYHGGDVYDWGARPHFEHAMIGGETNPAAVRHDARTRTFVNILNTHGRLERDVPVDVTLFDGEGRCVAERPGWCVAVRHGLARFDVADLLDDPQGDFRGHVSLRFHPAPGEDVPHHLQALLEYRSPGGVAHAMLWSDQWNSRVGLARRDRSAAPPHYRSWFRIRDDAGLATEIAVANAGHAAYDRSAEVRAIFRPASGASRETRFSLAPFATRWLGLATLFPDDTPTGPGMLVLESTSDLAGIAFTWHAASGSLACEHTMGLATRYEGRVLSAAGT